GGRRVEGWWGGGRGQGVPSRGLVVAPPVSSMAVRLNSAAARSRVVAVDQTARKLRITRELEQRACHEGGVREVGKHAIDAKLIELKVFVHRVAAIVGRQAPLLVAE